MALESARNTHAKDLTDTTQVYGSQTAVLQLLATVNMGTDLVALANLGATTARNALIDLFLPTASQKVRASAGRDFENHSAETVYINGPGDDRLDLSRIGLVPLISVTSIVVDSTTLSNANYVIGKDGWVQYNTGGVTSAAEPWKNSSGSGYFPRGSQNIAVTASWGYTAVPTEIIMAGNLFCAAYVLAFTAIGDSNVDDAIPGGDLSVDIGDLKIDQAKGSRYAPHISWMNNMAKSLCNRYRPQIQMATVNPE